MRFTWDPRKAKTNLAKHGVSFEEAASAVLDPFALEAPDVIRLVPSSSACRPDIAFSSS